MLPINHIGHKKLRKEIQQHQVAVHDDLILCFNHHYIAVRFAFHFFTFTGFFYRAKLLAAFRAQYGASANVKEIKLMERGNRTWLAFSAEVMALLQWE